MNSCTVGHIRAVTEFRANHNDSQIHPLEGKLLLTIGDIDNRRLARAASPFNTGRPMGASCPNRVCNLYLPDGYGNNCGCINTYRPAGIGFLGAKAASRRLLPHSA